MTTTPIPSAPIGRKPQKVATRPFLVKIFWVKSAYFKKILARLEKSGRRQGKKGKSGGLRHLINAMGVKAIRV